MNDMTQHRRVALVTGGATGIGLAIAVDLAQAGYDIAICDNRAEVLAEASTHLDKISANVLTLATDVTDEAAIANMMDVIGNRFGRLDILINNAGIVLRPNNSVPTTENTPLDVWRKSIDVNLTGVFLVCRAAIQLLRRSSAGRIVNISSLVGQAYSNHAGYYAASKAGVFGFSRILAGELGRDRITVNCIAPGMIRTPKITASTNAASRLADYAATTTIGRVGEMEDVVAAVKYLISIEAGFVTGEILNVNGGAFMP